MGSGLRGDQYSFLVQECRQSNDGVLVILGHFGVVFGSTLRGKQTALCLFQFIECNGVNRRSLEEFLKPVHVKLSEKKKPPVTVALVWLKRRSEQACS